MDDTAAFPRGRGAGGSVQRRRDLDGDDQDKKNKRSRGDGGDENPEKKKHHHSDKKENDFLFGNQEKDKKRQEQQRKKRKTSSSNGGGGETSSSHSLLPLGGGGVVVVKKKSKVGEQKHLESSSNLLIEAFGFSKLAKGTKVLGIVREIHNEYAILSLPNMLSGYVLPQKSSSQKWSLLNCMHVGQTLSVVVQKVVTETIGKMQQQQQQNQRKRRIQVSPLPNHINPRGDSDEQDLYYQKTNLKLPIRGQITSIEDHGCLVDLGYGRKGFLKYTDIEDKKNYKVLDINDDDEEDDDDDDDIDAEDIGKANPIIIQPGRLYDFFMLGGGGSDKQQVVGLSLPSSRSLAKQAIAPITVANKGPSRSKYTSMTTPYTINSIRPGWLVNVKVEALAKNGICVTFLNNVFRGAIELSQLGSNFMPTKASLGGGWQDVFNKHQHFQARVIAIDVPTKLIRLSLSPHILQLASNRMTTLDDESSSSSSSSAAAMAFPPIGTIIQDCTVIRQDPNIGALLALPESYNYDIETDPILSKRFVKNSDLLKNESYVQGTRSKTVYVHISKAVDPDGDTKDHDASAAIFSKEFAPTTVHDVRLLGYNHLVDGFATGACAPSILEAHVLTHGDLKPGQLYKQVPVCAQLQGGSILVQLGGSSRRSANTSTTDVRGLIPPMHLFDTSNSSEFRRKLLKAKFAVDAKIDVRVLSVDAANKKCIVTAKKSMVKVDTEDDIVTTFDELKVGKRAVGYVSRVDERAIFVTFCNKVYGRVTAKSLAADLGIENHTESYHVGDVVKCRVVKLKKRKSFGGRSMKEDSDEEDDDDEEERRTFWEVDLSLKVDSDDDDNDDAVAMDMDDDPKQIRVKAGAILPLKSMKIVELNSGRVKNDGSFVPGFALVSIKSKHVVDESMQASMAPNIECKLPYDQLLDSYDPKDIQSASSFDMLASRLLSVGKKINQKGLILTDPRRSNVDYTTGIGHLPVVSIRKRLIQSVHNQYSEAEESSRTPGSIIVPGPDADLYVGAILQGYVVRVDPRHGAFIRFLDGMTGLIPNSFGGCDLPEYETVMTQIKEIDDKQRPYKILLDLVGGKSKLEQFVEGGPYQVGDKVSSATVEQVKFHEAELALSDESEGEKTKGVRFVLHSTMKDGRETKIKFKEERGKSSTSETQKISKGHPFYGLKVGNSLSDLIVVAVKYTKGQYVVYLTDRSKNEENEKKDEEAPIFVAKRSDLVPGMVTTAFIDGLADKNKGIFVHVSPFVQGFVPGLEISKDLRVLNNLQHHIKPGTRIKCRVMDQAHWHEVRGNCPFASQHHLSLVARKSDLADNPQLFLSIVACEEEALHAPKPKHGDILVGRVQKSLPTTMAPSLMISLRGGYVGRSCITELEETDDWSNMPIGSIPVKGAANSSNNKKEDTDAMDEDDEDAENESEDGNGSFDEEEKETESSPELDGLYPDGKYVDCRVLKCFGKQSLVEVSLRKSRIEGDLDDDATPEVGETAQGYVVQTNKQGCFIRIARHIEGRSTLKELCDGFLPDPTKSFPTGRLVVGKVKEVHKVSKKSKNSKDPVRFRVDLDMRESSLLEGGDKVEFEDIEVNQKYKGTVTRVEAYGVFVQIENSKVSGLVHMSECSDKFIKNLQAMYDPGDLVKILVIKKDPESRQLGFSMKPSHFENDVDSDDEEISDDDESEQDDDDQVRLMDQDDDSDKELHSDDEDFASKLADKIQSGGKDEESSSDGEGSSSDDSEDSEDSDEDSSEGSAEDEIEARKKASAALDTDVGFEWDNSGSKSETRSKADSDDESSSDEEEEEDGEKTSSHKSRKKQAQRRREEREISRREIALADGTADENPETAGDFERLLAGNPNSSELWIRYMAFHLSLSDIPAARAVAEKAMERIEFREEKEKLNVWTALLTLEHKYGDDKSFQAAIERACGQNNPKQVYLRACEILEKDVTSNGSPDSLSRADDLFSRMCKKFKSKKTVWLAHLQYLLKQHRHQEGHALMKRALLSLAEYKHAETMSRFAQLEFEFGSLERARTIFDGIIEKYPKRLDLFFVYVDKEIKYGSLESARSILTKKVEELSLSDKKMKHLFKKWYRLEEEHGTDESQDMVKTAAREYVDKN